MDVVFSGLSGDRWHIWHKLAHAVGKEVAVHSGCWATASRVRKLDGGILGVMSSG